MSKQATLEFDGKKYEFPVTVGTEGEIGIEIKKLRGEAGLITLDGALQLQRLWHIDNQHARNLLVLTGLHQ